MENAGMDIRRFSRDGLGSLRAVLIDEKISFVAKDVAKVLEHSDPSAMCKVCRKGDVSVINAREYSDSMSEYLSQKGGNPFITVISESGLYRILAKSNLPKAEPFERWLFNEVLPEIRAKGAYTLVKDETPIENTGNQIALPQTYLEALKALVATEEAKQEAEKALADEKSEHERDNRDFRNGLDILESQKGQIADRQVAKALSTAGILTQKNSALEKKNAELMRENTRLLAELGRGSEYKAVKDLPFLRKYFRVNASFCTQAEKELDKISDSLGIPVKSVEDGDKTIKAYAKEVRDLFRDRVENDRSFLSKARLA